MTSKGVVLDEGVGVDDGSDDDKGSSDESVRDIHFDDSEEERVRGDDDGFDEVDKQRGQPKTENQTEEQTSRKLRIKTTPLKSPFKKKKKAGRRKLNVRRKLIPLDGDGEHGVDGGDGVEVGDGEHGVEAGDDGVVDDAKDVAHRYVPPNMDGMHVLKDEYLTDELDSASDSDSDGDARPKYTKFKEEDMTRKFNF